MIVVLIVTLFLLAFEDLYVCCNWIHCTWVLQMAWRSLPQAWPQVRWHPKWTCCYQQGMGSGKRCAAWPEHLLWSVVSGIYRIYIYICIFYYIIYHCNISTLKIYHSQRCSSCPCDSLGTRVIVFCRKVPGQGWAQIVAFLGTYELFINKPAPCLQSANRARNINFAKAFLIS